MRLNGTHTKRNRLLTVVILLLAVGACSRYPRPKAPGSGVGEVSIGLASFYGNEFSGRPTASGERYDPSRYTAAHRSLPFGSLVRVTNLANNRSVVVTINDRGPQRGDRILDLSYAAARELNMINDGVVRVRVEVFTTKSQR